MVNIDSMGAADITLFALLALADMAVLSYWRVRRQRRMRSERMTRSLRSALERENGTTPAEPIAAPLSLVFEQAG
jgi:hypothetical protein